MAGRRLARRLALRSRGSGLLKALTAGSDDPARTVLAEEAARIADRLDELDRIIAGDGLLWLVRLRRMDRSGDGSEDRPVVIEMKIDGVLSEARQLAIALSGILAKLTAMGAGARPTGKPAEPTSSPPAAEPTPIEKARAARDARIAGA